MTIKEFRLSQKLTQAELAAALGISFSSERQYEYGTRNPSATVFERIKEVFGVDLNASVAAPAEPVPVVEEKAAKPKRTRKKKEAPIEDAPAPTVEAKAEEASAKKPRTRKKKEAEAAPAEPALAMEEKVEEAPAKKPRTRKKKEAPVEATPSAEVKVDEKPAKKPRSRKKAAPTVIIQSIMGGEINVEEIIAKVGDVDAIYVKAEENHAYWVRGDESGAVNLW